MAAILISSLLRSTSNESDAQQILVALAIIATGAIVVRVVSLSVDRVAQSFVVLQNQKRYENIYQIQQSNYFNSDDESEDETQLNDDIISEPTMLTLPPPLVRHDSGQSDDQGMNCLHFFALTNEHVDQIAGLLLEEKAAEIRFNELQTLHHISLKNTSFPLRTTRNSKNLLQQRLSSITRKGPLADYAPTRSVPLNINDRIKFHQLTPLHFAAMNSSAEFITTLLKNGADVNARDAHMRTPLRLAANARRTDIIRLLLLQPQCTDLPDADGTTALRSAVFRSDASVVRVFGQVRPESVHASLDAPFDGHDVGSKNSGIHALHVSASFGCVEMIDMLVGEFGVEVDVSDMLGRTPLMYAATKGKWEAVQHLLNLSSYFADSTVLEKLSAAPKNAKVNALDCHGWSALHYAAVATKSDPLKTIEVLISNDAIVDAKESRYSLTPLHMAAKSGHVDILNLLISKGANPHLRTTDNRTSLCFAAYGSHVECVRALISASPDIIRPKYIDKKKGYSGFRGIFALVFSIPWVAFRFLLSLLIGCKPDLSFNQIYSENCVTAISPLHLAIRAKQPNPEIIDLLLCAGVDINTGIPVELGSSCFAFFKAKMNFILNMRKTTSAPEPAAEDDKILYVNPACFALIFGNPDVSLKLLSHKTQFCLAGIVQCVAIFILSAFSGRWDISWKTATKVPAGIFLSCLICFIFANILLRLIPHFNFGGL